eukprot:CAMPEP_0185574346 /NCGR_PEP_ID=MMETSP0434-20130131/5835_1 /TAXON_ID=626734 ORGANISM="Favella taraikaensis, Strain Fe Narragansett Bay" /NCGR_SAMPLE_ID=MMETSP0434 /ASSEMBLY_ACC=CAM_ASM_000379 /LENGTH=87 /DNA_ID=CAMNT_0028190885 /DNA_START=1018 /DNA_END=1281 /DNA_ORIENTATION=-
MAMLSLMSTYQAHFVQKVTELALDSDNLAENDNHSSSSDSARSKPIVVGKSWITKMDQSDSIVDKRLKKLFDAGKRPIKRPVAKVAR